jgi:hypothetical protein
MRHERAYSRRQRAVTFIGPTRAVSIVLELSDFERLEQLASGDNVGNSTLGRQIIRKYLKRQANETIARRALMASTGALRFRRVSRIAAGCPTRTASWPNSHTQAGIADRCV